MKNSNLKQQIKELELERTVVLVVFIFLIFYSFLSLIIPSIDNKNSYNRGFSEGVTSINKTNVECLLINKVTKKYWDIKNNVFTGENSYVENITKVDCSYYYIDLNSKNKSKEVKNG